MALLDRKTAVLREQYGIAYRITGVSTRTLGWLVAPEGFNAERLLKSDYAEAKRVEGLQQWLVTAKPGALFEASSLNAETGEPAITYLRAALEAGAHAISANKGPVVYAHRELTQLATARGLRFFHESAMMDGAPVFSLFRETLPAIELRGFRGVLNSTTNVILGCMESGMSFDDAVHEAQRLGVAETDPGNDIDGIDAAVKVIGLVNVLMDGNLKLSDVAAAGDSRSHRCSVAPSTRKRRSLEVDRAREAPERRHNLCFRYAGADRAGGSVLFGSRRVVVGCIRDGRVSRADHRRTRSRAGGHCLRYVVRFHQRSQEFLTCLLLVGPQ